MTVERSVPDGAADITEYGAEPNPDDASESVARRNYEALMSAIEATGDGGTVYVPEGTYYVATEEVSNLTALGGRDPGGISLVGEGPRTSAIGVSAHRDHPNLNFLRYDDGTDHGEVVVRDLHLDGNYERLLESGDVGGSRAINVRGGSMALRMENVWVRGWWQNGVYLSPDGTFTATVTDCRFERQGVGTNIDTPSGDYGDGNRVAHHTVTNFDAGDSATFRRCLFLDTTGQVTDTSGEGGSVLFERCYAEGCGTGVLKINGCSEITLRRSYFRMQNDFLRETAENFYGRNGVHMFSQNTDEPPTLRLDRVVLEDMGTEAISIAGGPTDEQIGLRVEGDEVAVRNPCTEGSQAIECDDLGTLTVDLGRLSVHDAGGPVFGVDGGSGSIDELRRAGTDGLGDPDDISIGRDRQGAETLRPTVPGREEVGLASSGDDGDDDSDDEPALGHTIAVTKDDPGIARGPVEYEITVSDELAATADVETGGNDARDGTTATGEMGPASGTDTWAFDGVVTDFSLSGEAHVYVDGERVPAGAVVGSPALDAHRGGYDLPARGASDWAEPLNAALGAVETDVRGAATLVDAHDGGDDRSYGGYERPAPGTAEWAGPLNSTIGAVAADVAALASRVDALDGGDERSYGDYDRPDRGEREWHEPLEAAFGAVAADLTALRARVAAVGDE